LWKGVVLAESDETIVVEGNHASARGAPPRIPPRLDATVCGWKGTASYYDIVVGAEVNHDGAWYCPQRKTAKEISGTSPWRGVVEP
jgi:uncharacterized protein (DUF427 family)